MSPILLTYSQGLARQAQALAHAGALREVCALYAHVAAKDPQRFADGPTPDEFAEALNTLVRGLRAMRTDDFREPCACVPGTAGWARHHGAPGGTLSEAFDEAMASYAEDVPTPLDPMIAALDFPYERHEHVTGKGTKREGR